MSSEKYTNRKNFRLSSEKCTNRKNFACQVKNARIAKIFACQVKNARIAKIFACQVKMHQKRKNFAKFFFRFFEKNSCKSFFGGYNRAHEKHIRCFSPLPLDPMEVLP